MPKIKLTFNGEIPTSCAECPLYDNNSTSIILCHGEGLDEIPNNCPVTFEADNGRKE